MFGKIYIDPENIRTTGGYKDEQSRKCSHVDYQRHVLRALLNYHERMMMTHRRCPSDHCDTIDACKTLDGNCPNAVFIDGYADALREAIRCIEIVHKGEFSVD